jgi:uncharacterized membrane protein YbhN (UPF0104 family)
MSPRRWSRLRHAGGWAILALLVWRLGPGSFVAGLVTVDAQTLAIGALIAVPTTVCCAWRWRLVARALGVGIALPTATAACYRSQFLNTVLPGGVFGDVLRGLRHGRAAADIPRSLRTVAWERGIGNAVLVALAVPVLLLAASPVRVGALAVLALLVLVVLAALLAGRRGDVLGSELRTLLAHRTWPGLAAVSALAVLGHVATLLVAARAAGATGPMAQLVPLVLVVLLATGVPLNVAGWGPREGVAAWAFAAAGLGAHLGVAVAVVYGVMALVGGLPGLVVLLVEGRGAAPTAAPWRRAREVVGA